jgi:hypothetical protein
MILLSDMVAKPDTGFFGVAGVFLVGWGEDDFRFGKVNDRNKRLGYSV